MEIRIYNVLALTLSGLHCACCTPLHFSTQHVWLANTRCPEYAGIIAFIMNCWSANNCGYWKNLISFLYGNRQKKQNLLFFYFCNWSRLHTLVFVRLISCDENLKAYFKDFSSKSRKRVWHNGFSFFVKSCQDVFSFYHWC